MASTIAPGNETPYPELEHIDLEKMEQYLQDRRVSGYDPLIQPSLLRHELPTKSDAQKTIVLARYAAAQIIAGKDDRILVIVGPCSIHSTEQAIEYANLLKAKIPDWPNLLIVMRAYFEKPRTTVGWKGLINDPDIDGSFQINKGLRRARSLLISLTQMGVPVGCELLDTISPQFISDLVSWGAIGARTTESQLHRELASGVSFPIGFKNGTDGSVTIAVDAMRASSHPHAFMGVTEQGLAAIVKTKGNKDVHVILRGANKGPNYHEEDVRAAVAAIEKARPGHHPGIMIDCSHGNSQKNHLNQPRVLDSICDQLRSGSPYSKSIVGVMIESHINGGRQDVPAEGPSGLKHGVSITDACVDWPMTVVMLDKLNQAVGARRAALVSAGLKVNGVNGA
ncbi:3-deoxy-7-phosphoheptulonate synthase [Punctularia strigosozonata HHB-11173 SS5]|uniref:3-deoxy-7-phosphoheptulonate synthase n=1 Tax=Punctularia strigosozonata (strain HHB-11173) TaxID=741275 RepID=UPI00044172ED|nr:3-deoxy-7-phosphoheptulonate synthase [Punctularia strigosozonata HHB-11173 SS5]EIN05862.1 3-deoxy-7-phosphoheptulonate synthase [Punctularia strigosozonata HHB-11173 SS5]